MRSNNFDALRMVGALLVVVGHGLLLTDAGRVPRIAGIPLHTLGLFIFFTISGYLIAGSWQRNPSLSAFLRNRALRLFPALIVVVMVTVLLIGPLVTSLSSLEYVVHPQTRAYLANIVMISQYELPGVFAENPHSNAVNGVLWTLGLECVCYLLTAVIGLFARGRSWFGFILFAGIAAVMSSAPAGSSWAWAASIGEVWMFFALGALTCSLLRERTLSLRPALLIIPGWFILGQLSADLSNLTAWVAIPYLVVAIGHRSWPGLRAVSRYGDFSYGTYLWGYLIQQLLVGVTPELPDTVSILIAALLALLIAALSWRFVERPSLTLKAKSPTQAPPRDFIPAPISLTS